MAALSNQLHGLFSDKAGAANFVTGTATVNGHLAQVPTSLSPSVSHLLNYLVYSSLLIPVILPLYRYILKDYNAFLALGPGGTPSTFNGYLWVTFLKIFFARSDIYVPPALKPYEHPAQGYLQALPRRLGSRPKVAGIAPHRQVTQKGSKQILDTLQSAIRVMRDANPDLLATGISCFEQHNLALFFSPHAAQIQTSLNPSEKLSVPAAANPRPVRVQSLTRLSSYSPSCEHKTEAKTNTVEDSAMDPCDHPAEIAHIHTTDSSMHLTLHPSDAALVISNGWGERHPLAGRGPWVPNGFTMVYAPRNGNEVQILIEIVRAAGWWVGGCMLLARAERDLNGGSAFGATSALKEVKIATTGKLTPKEQASSKERKGTEQNVIMEEESVAAGAGFPGQDAA